MKISIEIDCTPQEARRFLGLPDVEPLQQKMMQDMHEKMSSAMTMMDPEGLAKAWFPLGNQGLEQFQNLMFSAARAAAGGSAKEPDTSAPGAAKPGAGSKKREG